MLWTKARSDDVRREQKHLAASSRATHLFFACSLLRVFHASRDKTVDQGVRAKASICAEAVRHGNIVLFGFAPGAEVGSSKGRKGLYSAERAVLPAIDLGVQHGLWIGRGAQDKVHAEYIQVPAIVDQGKLPCARTCELLVFPKGTAVPAETLVSRSASEHISGRLRHPSQRS